MTTKKVYACAIIGLESAIVEVEADSLRSSQFSFIIVGLPDAAISEARERVRSAIKNSSLPFPRGKAVVNLAPADIKKQGPMFDLSIAISLVAHSAEFEFATDGKMFIGELALGGSLRPVAGILPIALAAQSKGFEELFVPKANAPEASLVSDLKIYPCLNLKQVIDHLSGRDLIKPLAKSSFQPVASQYIGADFKDIKGQESAKRVLEIAASGGHNILMSGPPGSGKTLLARSLPSILPDMTLAESLETTKIHSVAGVLPSGVAIINSRPFRSPHHTSSGVALVGGGAWPRPGEISLAHRGVLFLDEFTEFSKAVLENLRQPLEDGIITVSRAQGSLTFPAKFSLVAAMNPCPCGYATDSEQECRCSPREVLRYQSKISGPILDRIDLHIEVARVKYDKLTTEDGKIEDSSQIKSRVQAARDRQNFRFKGLKLVGNSELTPDLIKKFCKIDSQSVSFLNQAARQMHLSARSFHRVLKLGRTIADLAGKEEILTEHLAEALQYRPKLGHINRFC